MPRTGWTLWNSTQSGRWLSLRDGLRPGPDSNPNIDTNPIRFKANLLRKPEQLGGPSSSPLGGPGTGSGDGRIAGPAAVPMQGSGTWSGGSNVACSWSCRGVKMDDRCATLLQEFADKGGSQDLTWCPSDDGTEVTEGQPKIYSHIFDTPDFEDLDKRCFRTTLLHPQASL